jgi:hypothetical protein
MLLAGGISCFCSVEFHAFARWNFKLSIGGTANVAAFHRFDQSLFIFSSFLYFYVMRG